MTFSEQFCNEDMLPKSGQSLEPSSMECGDKVGADAHFMVQQQLLQERSQNLHLVGGLPSPPRCAAFPRSAVGVQKEISNAHCVQQVSPLLPSYNKRAEFQPQAE